MRRGARLPRPGRSRGRAQRARSATPASTTSATSRRPTATPPAFGLAPSCEDEVVAQLVELQRRARDYARATAGWRRRRLLLRRAERAPGAQRRGVLPHHVPRPRRRPGTCATGTWSRRSTRSTRTSRRSRRRRRKIVVWAHNSHLGDARATEMGERGRAERRPARARALRATTPCWSASRTYSGTRHGRVATGTRRPSASACGPACRAATRRCSTNGGPALPAALRDDEALARRVDAAAAASARSASIYRPRDRAREPLLPGATCASSSTA